MPVHSARLRPGENCYVRFQMSGKVPLPQLLKDYSVIGTKGTIKHWSITDARFAGDSLRIAPDSARIKAKPFCSPKCSTASIKLPPMPVLFNFSSTVKPVIFIPAVRYRKASPDSPVARSAPKAHVRLLSPPL